MSYRRDGMRRISFIGGFMSLSRPVRSFVLITVILSALISVNASAAGVFRNFHPARVVAFQKDMFTTAARAGAVGLDCGSGGNVFVTDKTTFGSEMLIVADREHHRVLIFKTAPSTNDATPDIIVGQADAASTMPNRDNGTPKANSFNDPMDACVGPDGQLIVADRDNHRVLIWNTMPVTGQEDADLVLGEPDKTTRGNRRTRDGMECPEGVAVHGTKLLVADRNNSRVLIWNDCRIGKLADGQNADVVVGQTSFDEGFSNVFDNVHMGAPRGIAVSTDGKLIVPQSNSSGHNRVMIWNTIPAANGAPADVVLGQPNFSDHDGRSGANGLNDPIGASVSRDGRIAVADYINGRVLIWNSIPAANGASADIVLGQRDFTANDFAMDPDERYLGGPVGVEWTADGRLWTLSLAGGGMVKLFDPDFAPEIADYVQPKVAPKSALVPAGTPVALTVSGGKAPFLWAMVPNGQPEGYCPTTFDAATGTVTPGLWSIHQADNQALQYFTVTDAKGQVDTAELRVFPAMTARADQSSVYPGQSTYVNASGGVSPYYGPWTFTVVENRSGGSVKQNPYGGYAYQQIYEAGTISGVKDVVEISDSAGNKARVEIDVAIPPVVSPADPTVESNQQVAFSFSGGIFPPDAQGRSWMMVDNQSGGRIGSYDGQYTAGPNAGTDVIALHDVNGYLARTKVTVVPGAAAAEGPTNAELIAEADQINYGIAQKRRDVSALLDLARQERDVIKVTCLDDKLNQMDVTGRSSLEHTDLLRAAINANNIPMRDSEIFWIRIYGQRAEQLLTEARLCIGDDIDGGGAGGVVVITEPKAEPLSLGQANRTVFMDDHITFMATGGKSPYAYLLVTNASSAATDRSATEYFYRAGGKTGVDVIRVTDAAGATADVAVTVLEKFTIAPASSSISAGVARTFTAAGGAGGYTFSLTSNYSGGSINSSSGEYAAGPNAGQDVVRVTDSLGNARDAQVNVTSPLSMGEPNRTVFMSTPITFTATGGTSPYAYLRVANGSLCMTDKSATEYFYLAGGVAGVDVIRVTDAAGDTREVTITVIPELVLNPASGSISAGSARKFVASGGAGGYTYSFSNGYSGGTIDAVSGDYRAGDRAGQDVVRVTDALGNTKEATINVTAPVSMGAATRTVFMSDHITFAATGGTPPYKYLRVADGSRSSITGSATEFFYMAGGTAGVDIIRATDAAGETAEVTITVLPTFTLTPKTVTASAGATRTFSATGGAGGFVFSLPTNNSGATIDAATGAYTAGANAGIDVVRVADSFGNMREATVTVTKPLSFGPSSVTVLFGQSKTFTPSGGTEPYKFWIVTNTTGARFDQGGNEFFYMAGGKAGTDVIKVTDAVGDMAEVRIEVKAPEPPDFGFSSSATVGMEPIALAQGDINKDGFVDFVTANWNSSDVTIALGNGSGGFSGTRRASSGTNPCDVALQDFNRDGYLDLAVTNMSSNNVTILMGDGTGSFLTFTYLTVRTQPHSVAAGDVNGDGISDLVVTNHGSNNVSYLKGTGNGNFTAAGTLATGTNPRGVALGDINADGRLDLVVANSGASTITIRKGTATGGFGAAATLNAGAFPWGIAIGDANADGKPDIAVSNGKANTVSFFAGNGDGSFMAASNLPCGQTPAAIAIADVNGDGRADIVTANETSKSLSVILSRGDGSFDPFVDMPTGRGPRAVRVADVNGDGKVDLISANRFDANIWTLLKR